jgi:hypothetical protein
MKTVTKSFEVYAFDELPENAYPDLWELYQIGRQESNRSYRLYTGR